jgi:hypothetical protein
MRRPQGRGRRGGKIAPAPLTDVLQIEYFCLAIFRKQKFYAPDF